MENSLIDVDFFDHRTSEIPARVYWVSITLTVSSCQQVESGVLLIISTYIPGLF